MALPPRPLLTWAGVVFIAGGIAVALGGGDGEPAVSPDEVVLGVDDLPADLGLLALDDDAVTGELGEGIEGGPGCPPFSIAHVFDEVRGDPLATADLADEAALDGPVLVAYTAAGEAEVDELDTFFADFAFPQSAECLAAELSIGPDAIAADGEVTLEVTERDGVREAIFRSVLPDGSATTYGWLANDDGIVVEVLLGSYAQPIDELDAVVLDEVRSRLSG